MYDVIQLVLNPMKTRFEELLKEVEGEPSPIAKVYYCTALWRILLQHLSIVLLELLVWKRSSQSVRNPLYGIPIQALLQPSDGTTSGLIIDLLQSYASEFYPELKKCLFTVSSDRSLPCWRLLARGSQRNAENVLTALTATRNDNVFGHGLPGEDDPEAFYSGLLYLYSIFRQSELIPRCSENGSLIVQDRLGTEYALRLLKMHDGRLSIYRRIRVINRKKCKVEVQVEKGFAEREKKVYEANFSFDSDSIPDIVRSYQSIDTGSDWSPLAIMPERETESFTGRSYEMDDITEWFSDAESRACLIYGDGGIGKTTFVVEALHRLLDRRLNTPFQPELITFFTAKMTRWGINGLEFLDKFNPSLDDLAREIVMGFEGGDIAKSWYTKSGKSLFESLSCYLSDGDIARDRHLVVLDNTETLAASPEDVKKLSIDIKLISQRIGRVIVTSRRREKLEAWPIEMPPLSEEEAVVFLRARARELNRVAFLQAGESSLKKYSRGLGCKPLLLEVLLQAVKDDNTSIQNAFDRVMRMQSQDLGEFLFSDAWKRLSFEMQHLLLLMTRVMDRHDEASLKLCCAEASIPVIEAYDALEESKGIASIEVYNDSYQIAFSRQFLNFASGRTVSDGNGNDLPNEAKVMKIRSRYNEFLRNESIYIRDRFQAAFRHPYAKTAFRAYNDEQYDKCDDYYQLALAEDYDNALLHDRYAFFLCSKIRDRLEDAYKHSMTATRLAPEDQNVWFTRGRIEAKMRRLNDAFTSLSKAQSLGHPSHLCHLYKCFAAIYQGKAGLPLARAELRKAEAAKPEEAAKSEKASYYLSDNYCVDDKYAVKFNSELATARYLIARIAQRGL